MTEIKIPCMTVADIQLFVNAKGKLDVDRLVEVRRLLEFTPIAGPIHLVALSPIPKDPIH